MERNSAPQDQQLLHQVVETENMHKAWSKVKSNKGAAGVDGRDIEETLLSSDRGTPQGGPLSPLLSNIILDDLDKELEKRGHSFVRYADDCNIYVRSRKAGDRVMQSLTKFVEGKLKLKVNREKSAVDRPLEEDLSGV